MINTQKYYYIFPTLFIIVVLIFLFDEYSKEKIFTIQLSNNFKAIFELPDLDTEMSIPLHTLPRTGLQPQTVKIHIFSLTFIIKKHNITANKNILLLKKILPIEQYDGFSLILTNSNDDIIKVNIILNEHDDIEEYIITIKNYSQSSISLPFSLTVGSNITISNNQIDIFSKSFNTYLTVSPNIKVKENNFYVQSRNSIIRISDKKDKKVFNNIALEVDKVIFPSIDLNPIIREYIEKSYYAWKNSRYQRSTGTWKYPHSIYAFNEDTLVASYSEALRQNEFPQQKLFLERIARLHKQSLSWKSMPILGTNDINIHNRVITTHFKNNLLEKNTEIFKSYLLDHSFFQYAYIFYQDDIKNMILQLLESLSFINCSSELAASLLYQSYNSSWKEANTIIHNNEEVLSFILLNNFVPTYTIADNNISFDTQNIPFNDDRIFLLLSNSNNQLDSIATLLAGKYFITQKNTELVPLGKKIIRDLLLRSDSTGFLPHRFIVNKKNIIPLGYLAPESIYSLLANNEYYPRISINKSLHILSVIPVSYTYQNNHLLLSIPTIGQNITKYIYVWNTTPPSRIAAFNALWKGNYNLDGLLRGVHYNSQTNTIMIKNRSKNKQEVISIQFK